MGRHIGTFNLVTEIAQVTFINDLPVILFIHTIDLEGFGFIDQVEQGREGITQGNATTAPMTYVVNPFKFVKQWYFVI